MTNSPITMSFSIAAMKQNIRNTIHTGICAIIDDLNSSE